MMRKLWPVMMLLLTVCPTFGQELRTFQERFGPQEIHRNEIRVKLSGVLRVTGEKDAPASSVRIQGQSLSIYDERSLPFDQEISGKTLRIYRSVELKRTINQQEQEATIRPGVQRMIVLRAANGTKAPFSPDGPLTWNEIDYVRHEVFLPTLVAGLLPQQKVRIGDSWNANSAAIQELTDLVKIEQGELKIQFLSMINLDKREYAKLQLSGKIQGQSEDGPTRHELDGMAYFDVDAERLSYLKVHAVQKMLDAQEKTQGEIEGTWTITRTASPKASDLTEEKLAGVSLQPDEQNSQLLYENETLGVRFLYPRRWRVGLIQGSQITLDGPAQSGIVITLTEAQQTETAQKYLTKVQEDLRKKAARNVRIAEPRPVKGTSGIWERFAVQAEINRAEVRLEYAVNRDEDGGATLAARIPIQSLVELGADWNRILKEFRILPKKK